jgi:hypothetical protein
MYITQRTLLTLLIYINLCGVHIDKLTSLDMSIGINICSVVSYQYRFNGIGIVSVSVP